MDYEYRIFFSHRHCNHFSKFAFCPLALSAISFAFECYFFFSPYNGHLLAPRWRGLGVSCGVLGTAALGQLGVLLAEKRSELPGGW